MLAHETLSIQARHSPAGSADVRGRLVCSDADNPEYCLHLSIPRGVQMNPTDLYTMLESELSAIKEAKTFKYEVPLESQQGGRVKVEGRDAVMLASNDYLGLSNHPRIKAAAHRALDEWGYGMASVRFLCGTEPIHFELERRIAKFVG